VALALAAVAAVGWKFGRMAADVETSVTQLDALTVGKGAETFKELQAWAAKTPFAIDDATEATKKLVAAGVPLKQIPDWLNDIGNVASATGVPIAQVGTVFAQMVSKGKASYEELQQLAEAGVPVWGALGDKLNMPIAQVQKLATEGKLGADAIDLVRESLNEMYPTAMADQAGTFNGQLSTFQDTLSQTGQTLGTLFLPGMTQLLEFLNTMLGPIMATTQSIANLNSEMEQFTGGTGLIGLNPAKQLWGFFTGGADKSKESVKQLGTTSEEALAKVKAGLEGGAMSAEQLEQQARDIAEAFKGIGASVRAKVGFIIQKANLRSDILKAVGDGVKLPADLTIGQIGGLGDKKQKLIQDISAFAEEGLSEGARRAELNPNFDKAAWYAKVREGTRGLLIKAGIDKTEVDRVLANIMGLPRQMPPIGVTANTTQADASIAQTTAPKTVPITPTLPGLAASNGLLAGLASPRTAPVRPTLPGLGVASGMMSNLARPRNAPVTPVPRGLNVAAGFLNKLARPGGKGRTAPITPIATGAKPVQGALDKAAKPGGKARKAPVAAQVEKLSQLNSALKKATKPRNVTINVDDKGTASAKSAIDNAAKDRNTTIWVTTRKRGGGGGGGGGATAGTQSVAPSAQMMSLRTMAAAVAAPGADPWFSPTARVEARTAQAVARQAARVTSEPTQLAPRRTPVKIYLDGAEIADHLTLKTGRMAQVSLSGRKA